MKQKIGIALTTLALMAIGVAPAQAAGSSSAKAPTARIAQVGTRHKHRHHARVARCRRVKHRVHGKLVRTCIKKKKHSTRKKHGTTARIASTGGSNSGSNKTNNGSGSTGTPADHVPTWAYDDGCNGGTGASASLVQQWVTYAESNCGPDATKAISDCHANGVTYCQALAYLDTNDIYSDSVPIAQDAQNSWWLHQPGHTDSANRLKVPGFGGGYLLDQANPAVQNWYKNYVATNFNSFDGLMMDDQSASLNAQLYGTGASTSQEITTDAQLEAAHEAMSTAVTHANGSPMLEVDNSINVNPYLPSPFKMLSDPSSVNGMIAEGAPWDNGQIINFFPTLLDDMAYVDHTSNDFMTLLSYDPSGSLQARRVQAASVLLGYSGNHIVSWSDLEQNSNNLAIWPEEGIVPAKPVQSMSAPGGSGCMAGTGATCSTGGHNDLQVATGVYRREFSDCYNQGKSFGPCATIVNTTNSSVTVKASWLTQSYSHRITMQGGDVQSGGTVNLTGASFTAGSTTVAANDALMIAS